MGVDIALKGAILQCVVFRGIMMCTVEVIQCLRALNEGCGVCGTLLFNRNIKHQTIGV